MNIIALCAAAMVAAVAVLVALAFGPVIVGKVSALRANAIDENAQVEEIVA